MYLDIFLLAFFYRRMDSESSLKCFAYCSYSFVLLSLLVSVLSCIDYRHCVFCVLITISPQTGDTGGAVSPNFWKSLETAPDHLVICKRGMSKSRHFLSEFPQPLQSPSHFPLQEQPLGQPIHLTPRFFSLWM